VGALIEDGGRYMVCRRPASSNSWPGAWEFPGGKVEADEDDRAALARELDEELGIKVDVGALFHEVLGHNEGHRVLDFRVYRCAILGGVPRPLGVDEIRWVSADGLARMHFPTADRPAVRALLALSLRSAAGTAADPGRITP